MNKKQRFLALGAVLGLAAAASAANPGDPVQEIQKKDRDLQAMLARSKSYTKVQQDSLKVLINGIFDFSELGKKALGANWDKLNKSQQDSFVTVFRRMVENNSIKRLENYRSDSATYTPASGKGAKTSVKGLMWFKGKSTPIEYKLLPVDGRWKAWDLVINGASTVSSYKKTFTGVMNKGGYDALMAKLRKSSGA